MPEDARPTPPAPDLSAQPLRFLHAYWRVWQALAARAEVQLSQEHGLDLRAFLALSYLQGGVTGPGELAVQLGLPRYVITRTLDALSRLEAVRRVADPHDARRQQLTVTPAGHVLWRGALQTVESVCEAPLSELGAQLGALTLTLERLATSAAVASSSPSSSDHPKETP